MPLIDSTDYDAIRRTISASFDVNIVSDPMIETNGTIEKAIAWVAARTSDTGFWAKSAAINYAAYLLVPSLRGQLQAAHNRVAGGNAPTNENWKQLADELLKRAERDIDSIPNVQVPEPVETPTSCSVRTVVEW